MKRLSGVIATCAFGLLLVAPRARAQIPTPYIGVGAGPAFPLGSTHDAYNTGYNVLIFGGVNLGLVPLAVRIDGSLAHLSPQGFDGHDNLWSGTANLVYKVSVPIVQPYIIGGMGYYYTNVEASTSGSKFGLNAGVGAQLHVPLLFSVFGEIRYHYVVNGAHAIQYAPLTFGVRL
ncbi:MAG TPA: outer membrane beta-barrel protein [Gemmatimonadaceae bacterium]|nr:outer membrane beta-barrel protein [Gemmatimonadaceae bacterium]